MAGYTKLFSTIVTSTIWLEPLETKVLWITLLALANKDGVVEGSLPGIAKMAGLDREQAERAFNTLLSPDPDSRTKDDEGRRVRQIDGGWFLINHGKYRALLGVEERREYLRKKQAEFRARKQASTNVNNVSDKSTPSTHAEADSEAKAPKTSASLPFLSESFAEAWKLFVQHRTEIRKPLKPTSEKLTLKFLESLGETRAIIAIHHTIQKGWQGIREPDEPPTIQRNEPPLREVGR